MTGARANVRERVEAVRVPTGRDIVRGLAVVECPLVARAPQYVHGPRSTAFPAHDGVSAAVLAGCASVCRRMVAAGHPSVFEDVLLSALESMAAAALEDESMRSGQRDDGEVGADSESDVAAPDSGGLGGGAGVACFRRLVASRSAEADGAPVCWWPGGRSSSLIGCLADERVPP